MYKALLLLAVYHCRKFINACFVPKFHLILRVVVPHRLTRFTFYSRKGYAYNGTTSNIASSLKYFVRLLYIIGSLFPSTRIFYIFLSTTHS
ncbi:hypothetical protein PUN28_015391 [Cardiocondyla obscurior]|uniref:Secreted protein n=1 Tax=Cardiocondyla obscurior TaxID=286306 RepID=A0AAW2EV43_9HYME